MRIRALLFSALGLVLVVIPAGVFAAEGTISDSAKYAWGENMGWINFLPDGGGLTITDSAVTGYAWSSTAGWINFSPDSGGVTNTSGGVLGGSAWVQDLGWLDMSGITINTSGKFTGTAGIEGSSAGRVSFDCTHCDVETDWRPTAHEPLSLPTPVGNTGSGSNGSFGTVNVNPIPSSTDKNTPASAAAILTALHIAPPTASSHTISAFNKPLIVTAQHGVLTQTFGHNTVVVDIPAGASKQKLTITVVQNPQPADFLGGALFIGGVVFDVTARDSSGAEVHQFDQPLQITLSIPVPLQDKDIGVYWFDVTQDAWQLVPDAVFHPSSITFSVDHLTRFAILKASGRPGTIHVVSAAPSRIREYGYLLLLILVLFAVYLYRRSRRA